LKEDIENLLTFYELPKVYWKRLRTTNPIERVFREVRRRIRPMICFQNRNTVKRIIFAIFHRQNRIWEN
jgi:transposase-like protein